MSDNRNRGDDRDDLDSIAEVLDDLDFGRQTESLAPPLGAPPPLPPPPELEDEDVLSSAPRPAPRTLTSPRAPRELTPPPPGNLLDAPTDDEVFGSDFDDELDDVFAAIGAPSSKPKPRPAAVPVPVKAQEFSESTRIHEVEEDLLERSAREEPRRTAAVVRRDQLPAKDPMRKTGPSSVLDIATPTPFEEHTRIADLIEEREASHAPEPEEEPPPQVALDESFYDDIEIGAASGPEHDADEEISRPAAPAPQARRVTQNVVRRGPSKATETSQPRIAVTAPREASQPRIIVDEAVGGPLLEDLFNDGASGTAPAGSDDDGETIDREAARRRGIGSPLEEAVAEFAAATGQTERPADVDDYDSFSQSDAEKAEDDLPNEAWADALDRARADVPQPADDAPPPPDDDSDDDPVGTFSMAEVETPSARRAAQPRGPRERRPRNPIPEVEETFLDLPLELDAVAVGDGAPGGEGEPADVRRARLLDELEEARRADVPPRDLARLLLAAGQASEAAGDRDAASDCYDEALHLDETFAPALRAHRRLLVASGKYAAAARLLELEVGLAGPDERAALAAFRGDLLMAIGEEDLARVAFGELVDARPDDVRSLLAQLELAYTDGRDDEVAAILAALGPHLADTRLQATLAVLRGRLAEKQRRTDEADQAYQTAFAADEGNRAAAWGLARLAFAKGRVADAARWFPAMLAGVEDPALTSAAQRQQVVAALATGDSALAIEAAERAASESDPLSLEAMAEAYSWAARRTETVLALQAWADAEPAPARRAEILRRLLRLHQTPAEGTDDTAADVDPTLTELVAADPDDSDAREELAARRLAAGDLEAAAALSVGRADVGAQLAAMRLFEQSGRVDEAAAALAELVTVVGDSRVLAEARTGLYARAGAAHAGKLAALLAEDANDWRDPSAGAERLAWAAQSWAAAAGADEAESAEAQAVDAWRGLVSVDPGAEAAHTALISRARALAEAGGDRNELIEALAQVAQVTRDPARLAATSVEEAALRLRAGHDPDAIRAPLDRVLQAAPGEPRAVALSAALSAARGEWSDYAARLGERADLLGIAAARTGKEAPEAEALRFRAAAALARDPGEAPRALEMLGSILDARPGFAGADLVAEQAARASGDVALLVSLAERDVDREGDPLGPARLLRLAELHEQAGDATRAASRYRALLETRRHDPLARAGFERVAGAAGALAVLGDLALEELRRAEEDGDPRAKIAA
jgi:hypothetical protein